MSACLLGVCCRYDGQAKPHEGALSREGRHPLTPLSRGSSGGSATPRPAAERVGERVLTAQGGDVTAQYRRGAEETLRLGRLYGCEAALLKEHSPSCGSGVIHIGRFDGGLTPGDGVTAALLRANGIAVYGESEWQKLL